MTKKASKAKIGLYATAAAAVLFATYKATYKVATIFFHKKEGS